MGIFRYIFVFYALKFSPMVIDSKSNVFWRWCVRELNMHREGKGGWVLYRIGRVMVRDLYAHPMRSKFAFSKLHPFVLHK